MASSSNHPFSFDDEFQQAIDYEFANSMRECLDDINEVLEPEKRREKRAVIDRRREEGNIRLINDYFSENAIYPEAIFRRRFRMNRPLFMRIVNKLSDLPFFQHIPDGTGKPGLTGLQKCTAAIRMLAYGNAADAADEYLRLGASTALKCLHKFTNAIIVFTRRTISEGLHQQILNDYSRSERRVDFLAQ
ncbi:unnamed protein product [Microthlaspi erraticum]|uniref:Nuclease HARBI1 n=1 Tax=Microthlaspi erraticum TaxID=1685480 RepID=A0A6D2I655_9BRAS|nr:unnamed protein product [Microthlaspi erraticum]